MMIIGMGALAGAGAETVLRLAAKIAADAGMLNGADGWNGFNVLHTAASRVAGLDMCFLPREGGRDTNAIVGAAKAGELDVLYLLGVDEIPTNDLGSTFVVYQGTHGDAGAHRADVILPGAAYTEKSGTYVNTEGRTQMARRAAFPPGDAREDWAILRALSEVLGHKLGYDNITALRSVMYDEIAGFGALEQIDPADPAELAGIAQSSGAVSGGSFASPISDFYLTNPITRASKIMAECSALAKGGQAAGTGTNG